MPKPEHGRIVWAQMRNSDGSLGKCRTGVILTKDDDILDGQPFVVVAVTSTFDREHLPGDHVLLPWAPTGRCVTKLNREVAAVATWLEEIREADIQEYRGVVPPHLMREIVRRSPLGIDPA